MVNTQLFQTLKGKLPPQAKALNEAGAPAYFKRGSRHAGL